MADHLLVQTLGVSYQKDARGVEGLLYSPAALVAGEAVPESVLKITRDDAVCAAIEQVRRRIEMLVELAKLGRPRQGTGIEGEAAELADQVLPDRGFCAVVKPGVHPLFDIASDLASMVPWEVLEERYFVCNRPGCGAVPTCVHRGPSPAKVYCQWCGGPMQPAGGKLALARHLCHLVRGGEGGPSEGRDFLIVEDPTGDLCAPRVDPEGACAAHLAALEDLLERHGFRVNLLAGPNATRTRVVKALRNPALAGVYYFGHGFFSPGDGEGCLVLADSRLYAAQIKEIAPAVRFALINACHGADEGRDWGLDRKVRSVGQAFARGSPARCVVAPLWPVVNVQAAQFALEFFGGALAGKPLGEALRVARRASLRRYEDEDQPDISWMAYRFYGDPNRTLCAGTGRPAAARDAASAQDAAAARDAASAQDAATDSVSRLFDQDARLATDLFRFDVSAVLLRAAKRRNRHHREQATPADLLAGLLRAGSLTRHMVGQFGADPDDLYKAVLDEEEAGPRRRHAAHDRPRGAARGDDAGGEGPPGDALAKLRRLLRRFLVRDRDEFRQDLIDVLRRAERIARERADRRIAEQDLLDALTAEDRWAAEVNAELPSAAWVRRWLAERTTAQTVDENGQLLLGALSAEAREVVEAAHALAQQRGIVPIPNRLVLSAFFDRPAGERPSEALRP